MAQWDEIVATPSDSLADVNARVAALLVRPDSRVRVRLQPGRYQLQRPLQLATGLAGGVEHDGPRVEWTADEPGRTVLSGGALVGEWTQMGTSHGGWPAKRQLRRLERSVGRWLLDVTEGW